MEMKVKTERSLGDKLLDVLENATGGRLWVLKRLMTRPTNIVSFVILMGVVFCAIFESVLPIPDPQAQDLRQMLMPPSSGHLFGQDYLGRDVLSRVIVGSQIALNVGVISVGVATLVGVVCGVASGYFGKWVDNALMRVVDAFLSFPAILLALAIAAALGAGVKAVTIAIAVVTWPYFARLVRGQVLSVRERDFVAASLALGASNLRIMYRHIWPSVVDPVIVQFSLTIAVSIIVEASLSFLGLGVEPGTASWGGMLREGYGVLESAWWASVFPGLAIAGTVMAFNLFGDGLRDALDPRLYKEISARRRRKEGEDD